MTKMMVQRISRLRTYLLSPALVGAAVLLQFSVLHFSRGHIQAFTPFYPAVLLAALFGTGPGLVAVALSLIAASIFMEPVGTLSIASATDLLGLMLFLFVGVFIVVVCDWMRRAVQAAQRAGYQAEQSERQFRLTADSAPVIIWMTDTNKSATWFNKAWLDYVGRPLEAELGNGWIEHVHAEDRDRCLKTYNSAFDAHVPFKLELRLRRHDGEYRWFLDNGVPLTNPAGQFVGYIGSCADITDRKLAEEWDQLRMSQTEEANQRLRQEIQARRAGELAQARLGAIVESSDDAIVGKTLDGIITSWNQGAQQIFGWTAEEAIGSSILMLIPPELQSQEATILSRLRSGQRIEHFETERMRKDGSRVQISLTVSPIRDFDGNIVGASKIARDITEKKRIEFERDRLLEAERAAREHAQHINRMKDEFLATLSHELRTPLNAIMGWSQLLAMRTMNSEDTKQAVEIIERNARMQKQLIEDLLDMSRIVSGKIRLDLQQVWPNSFIEAAIETVAPAAEAKGIRIENMLDPHAGPVRGDQNRLQQVVWNLLSNAIKFTPRNGKVQVSLQRVSSHIELGVSDSGQGINPEFLPYVFDRFRQADASTGRKHGGLGLGLAIVKQLVELHGGSVRVHSEGEGRGATFSVNLPLPAVHMAGTGGERLHPTDPSVLPLESSGSPELSGLKVLVVDDEADARELVRRLLDESGAEVVTAGSADIALPLLQTEIPDVLVSDIGMPGVDGYEFLRKVRALKNEKVGRVPAVALTAFARTEDRTRALRAGYLAHVSKPVEPSELIATVAAVAGRAGRRTDS